LFRPHAFEVRERNLELFGKLPAREIGDAVLATAIAGTDRHPATATLIGTALQERRGHHEVPLGRELALQFLRQTYETTSAFHIEYSKEKRGRQTP
jgi:hypothetical protein